MLVIDVTTWQWPQWIVAIIYAASFAADFLLHGKPKKEGKYNAATGALAVIVMVTILGFGGFWG